MSKRTLIVAAIVVALAVGLFFWLQPATRFVYALTPIAFDEAVLLTRRNEDGASYFWVQLVKSDGTIRWSVELTPYETVEADGITAAVATAERVFLLGGSRGELVLSAFAREDGDRLWAKRIGQHGSIDSAGPSLVVDDARIFAMHDAGDSGVTVTTLDFAGRVLWSHTASDYGIFIGSRIIEPGDSYSAELDRVTGNVARTRTMNDVVVRDVPLGVISTRGGRLTVLGLDDIERGISLPRMVSLELSGMVGDDLVVVFRDVHGSAPPEFARIRPTSGEVAWRLPLPSEDFARLIAPTQVLPRFTAIALGNRALVVDLASGTVVAQQDFPFPPIALSSPKRSYILATRPEMLIGVDPDSGALQGALRIDRGKVDDLVAADIAFGRLWVAGDGWAEPDAIGFGVFDLDNASVVSERGELRFVPVPP